jgi:hypothetical protein
MEHKRGNFQLKNNLSKNSEKKALDSKDEKKRSSSKQKKVYTYKEESLVDISGIVKKDKYKVYAY